MVTFYPLFEVYHTIRQNTCEKIFAEVLFQCLRARREKERWKHHALKSIVSGGANSIMMPFDL